MEREAIERLAIDSATGELNEDAEALLRTYLAEHPQANEWAGDMLQVCQKTQTAIDAKINSAEAGLESAVLKAGSALWLRWRPAARWAAVVLFAALIGAEIGRWSTLSIPPQETVMARVSPGSIANWSGRDLEDTGTSFWRTKAATMLNAGSPRIHRQYVTGQALLDKYRQYIKEKDHE